MKYKVNNHSKWFGETDLKRGVVTINKKKAKVTKQKGELANSINHELLHVKHPKWLEKTVQKKADNAHLSKKTKQKNYAKFKTKASKKS